MRTLTTALVASVVLLAAGCGGSAISPEEALSANRAILGQGADSGSGGTVDPGVTDPGVVDPGTGGDSGVSDPGTGGGSDTPGASDSGSGGGGGGGGTPPAGGGVKTASCAGFKNATGITDDEVVIGNGADLSGPIPGLFSSAQLATKAYVSYFNSTNPNGICGRKIKLITEDTRTDGGADLAAYTKFCNEAFAAVGSMAVVDSGGAKTAENCKIPDIRTAGASPERNACATCFATQASGDREYTNAVYDYWIGKNKAATQKAAFLYINVGAAAQNGQTWISVGKKRGMNWVYTSPVDAADFNYGPYVQQMKSKGVQFVQFVGAHQQSTRLLQAMEQAQFKPAIRMFDPSMYDEAFLKNTGPTINGIYMYSYYVMLNANHPELNLYRQWLNQVSPGAKPTFYGLFAWSASKLFVEKALALGGNLSRASLVTALKNTSSWTGGGLSAPMDVGGKHAPSCIWWLTVKGQQFTPFDRSMQNLLCKGYSKA